MIKTQNTNFSSYAPQIQGPSTVSSFAGGNRSSNEGGRLVIGVGDRATFSPEARGSDSSEGVSTLLGGLNAWGSESNSGGAGTSGTQAGEAAQAQGSGTGWDAVMESGQMPISIIEQIAGSLNAGGMATAGALHTLLSWGVAEKEKTGEIREEFQDILHKAIDFGKKNKVMSAEDLAKYEQRLFTEGNSKGGGSNIAKGKDKGKVAEIGSKVRAAVGAGLGVEA